jgi:hypothetical protein
VKKINFSALPSNPSDSFIELVPNISKPSHPNLYELDGCCSEHGQCLLAYDFYRNGSLPDFILLSDGYNKPLPWSSRVKIALESGRALEQVTNIHEINFCAGTECVQFEVVMLEPLNGRIRQV